ncbi:MAG: TrmH family RNA methyltransferase [Nitrospiraceae bacterium]
MTHALPVGFHATSADPFSPEAVRATASTLLQISVLPGTTLADIQRYRYRVYAGDSDRKQEVSLPTIIRRPARSVLAFGNESRGLTDELRHLPTDRFYITTREEVESLNVASSAGIALFHFTSLPFDSNGSIGT